MRFLIEILKNQVAILNALAILVPEAERQACKHRQNETLRFLQMADTK